jgi:aspartyl-tRNA(Asn)/glutamyl-tRNA(Gln) amidotransferase subunit C
VNPLCGDVRPKWRSEFGLKISREDVMRVAELAHLELTAEEISAYQGQLDDILTYIEKLNEIDVTDVEPMTQVLFNPSGDRATDAHPELREDILAPCDAAEAILSQAQDAEKPFFRVPKVIER